MRCSFWDGEGSRAPCWLRVGFLQEHLRPNEAPFGRCCRPTFYACLTIGVFCLAKFHMDMMIKQWMQSATPFSEPILVPSWCLPLIWCSVSPSATNVNDVFSCSEKRRQHIVRDGELGKQWNWTRPGVHTTMNWIASEKLCNSVSQQWLLLQRNQTMPGDKKAKEK